MSERQLARSSAPKIKAIKPRQPKTGNLGVMD